MSFLKIKNPAERERVIKEFLEIKKSIRANELAEKTGKIELREDLSELFKPVTEAQKTTAREITEGLRPIKEGIEQLPHRIPRQETVILPPPPTLEIPSPLHKNDDIFGVYQKGDKIFIGDSEIIKTVDVDGKEYISVGENSYLLTNGLYNLITYKNPDRKSYNANDLSTYKKILENTNNMYVNNDPKTGKFKLEDDPKIEESLKWSDIIAPSWNRMQGKKRRAKKKGKGLKKVVIPSDPNVLLERLDLLMASKAAGHTGLRNELVSVCDELKRQGILNGKSYKKITSLL